MVGVPSWYTCSLHTPGYTVLTTVPATVQAPRHSADRLTALRRGVTELHVSDEGFTVAQSLLSLSTRFTVGQLLSLSSNPQVIPYGRRACCAECPPQSTTRFTVGQPSVRLRFSSFCQEWGNQAALWRRYGPAALHPFHCWSVRKRVNSRFTF